jgi:hypothetical protein
MRTKKNFDRTQSVHYNIKGHKKILYRKNDLLLACSLTRMQFKEYVSSFFFYNSIFIDILNTNNVLLQTATIGL